MASSPAVTVQRSEVEGRKGVLKRCGGVGEPAAGQAQAEVAQQLSRARAGGDRAFHREGVDDLRRYDGVFGVDAVEKGQHIAEKGVGSVFYFTLPRRNL